MRLDRYIARRFLQSFAMIGTVFITLVALVDLVDQSRSFDSESLGALRIFGLTALNVPAVINQILPLLVILATVWMFISLARTSELVVIRASGRSGIRVLLAPVFTAFVIGVLAVVGLNPLVATTSQRYQELRAFYKTGSESSISISAEGLWMRQGNGQQQSIIQAKQYDRQRGTLLNVSLITFDNQGELLSRIRAATARLEGDQWKMTQAKYWPIVGVNNPEAEAEFFSTLDVPAAMTQEQLTDALGDARFVSVFELPALIAHMQSSGFDSRYYEVWLQVELARPLFLIAMVLVAASFTMRHVRFGGTGVAALMSVLLGFGFYFVRNFAQVLGEHGQVPIMIAAWTPPLASILLTLGLLLQSEDG